MRTPRKKIGWLRQAALMGVALGWILSSPAQIENPGEELQTLKTRFDDKLAEIVRESTAEFTQLQEKVDASLVGMLDAQKERGNLSYALAIKDTRDAIRKQGELPEKAADPQFTVLNRLQKAFQEEKKRIETAKTSSIRSLISSYQQGLEQRELALTRAGKIDAAIKYKNERGKVDPEPFIGAGTSSDPLSSAVEAAMSQPGGGMGSGTGTGTTHSSSPSASFNQLPGRLREGIVFYLPFGPGSSDIANASEVTCRIENHGVEVQSEGLNGAAGHFDGNDNLVLHFPDGFSFSEAPFSFSCWIKPDGRQGDREQVVIYRGGKVWDDRRTKVALRASLSKVLFEFPDSELDTRANLRSDSWNHVAVCWNPTRRHRTIWINGIRGAQRGTRGPEDIDHHRISIGCQREASTGGFTGLMDEIIFYNRAITDAEVKGLYEAHKPR